jgi:Zn-dependent metalloprotease
MILGFPTVLRAQGAPDPVLEAVQSLEQAAGGAVTVTQSRVTGLATFISTGPGRPIPVPARATASREEKALAFVTSYGKAFGLHEPSQVQVAKTEGPDEVNMEHVRFQQFHKGVRVTGGEMTVHLHDNAVVAVNAKTLSDLEHIDTVPGIDASVAVAAAQEFLAHRLGVTDADIRRTELQLLNKGLLAGTPGSTCLTWFMEATRPGLREFLWVTAQTGCEEAQMGDVLLFFNQQPDAQSRAIHDAGHKPTLPGTLVRSEGGPATGDADADAAYEFAGDTYNFYRTQFGRDSFDNAGAPIVSTVHYCPNSSECPYQNAFWSGTQMVYGDGYAAADDVVAHELTHAVTEHSANLYYWMQSGALNESKSDIFAETIDLLNGKGTDTPEVRWLIGEDLPGGSIRDMMDPTVFFQPGKMSDFFAFKCSWFDPPPDSGGVHINSGVPNHAYALMVDGGRYNGFTISGIGLIKAAKIEYRALTRYLHSAANFLDNYHALQQSCIDLIGSAGITATDCMEVTKALDAVEMSNPWPCSPHQPAVPDLCQAGQTPTYLFNDSLENTTSGNWTTHVLDRVHNFNHWTRCDGVPDIYCTGFATSGVHEFWGWDSPGIGDSTVEMSHDITLPAGDIRMQFNLAYGFDAEPPFYYDGAVVEYSINSGATWFDAGAFITAGAPYSGKITASANPLARRNAWVFESFGYTAAQLELSPLTGRSVRFRFRVGTDNFSLKRSQAGVFIDDVSIYQCTNR